MHRAIQFNQKGWLKLYIDTNTDYGRKAKDEYEKYFLKLMNNSLYGKNNGK